MKYLWLNDVFAFCSAYNEEIDACRSVGISKVLQRVAIVFQNVANTVQVAPANGIPKEQKTSSNLSSPELIFYLYNFLSARIDFTRIFFIISTYIYIHEIAKVHKTMCFVTLFWFEGIIQLQT